MKGSFFFQPIIFFLTCFKIVSPYSRNVTPLDQSRNLVKVETELERLKGVVSRLNTEIGTLTVDTVSTEISEEELSPVEHHVEQNDSNFASAYNYTTNVS